MPKKENQEPAGQEPPEPSARIAQIGPKEAAALLAGNKYNRKVNVRRVARYAAQMVSKHWVFTGESVILNGDEMLDGAHRCRAIAESGVTIPLVIVSGVDQQAFKYIDSGAGRNLSDSLYIENRPHPRLYAAAVNYLTGFLKYNRWTTLGIEIHDRWKVIDDYTELEDIIPLYAPRLDLLSGINRGVMIAAHALFGRKNEEQSAEFSELLISETQLPDGHPVKAFHQWWASQLKRDPAPRDLTAKTGNGLIRTWNAYRNQEQLDKLRPPTTAPEIS
jgi:hypothetical protein